MVEDARIYYLFDRDRTPGSNSNTHVIKQFMSTLKNYQDNRYDMQGLLLLSYPAIESFTLENFYKDTWEYEIWAWKWIKEKWWV